MSYAMLSVDTVAKAAAAAMEADLDPHDLEGLSGLTRLNLLAALAMAAQGESPPVASMAVSPDDFALLSTTWEAAREAADPREQPPLPKPRLIPS